MNFGMPRLVADSLPDKFGNAVIKQRLLSKGRSLVDFTPVDRLTYAQLLIPREIEQFYRRMVFNCLVVNQDDHVKNVFLTDRSGKWTLASAYDITLSDILNVGKNMGLKEKRCKEIKREIEDSVAILGYMW